MATFSEVAQELVTLHENKDHDYGNAFADSFAEYGMVAPVIRLNDKMNRLKVLTRQEARVKTESVRDTLMDMAAYAIMTISELDKRI